MPFTPDAFTSAQPRLLAIAWRLAGNREDAEDIVQDAWVRWARTDQSRVRDARAFLVTITRNVARTTLQSAHHRRELAAGDRIDGGADERPAAHELTERAEAMTAVARLLLERLTPLEMAAFVLREGFDYPHALIGEVLGLREEAARQLAARSRRAIAGPRRAPVDAGECHRLSATITRAQRCGAMRELEELLRARTSRSGALPGPVGHALPQPPLAVAAEPVAAATAAAR